MEHFGAAVTAQQLPSVEAHGAEVLVLHGYWGPLLGSRGPRNESLLLRRYTLPLWCLLPSQRSDSDLSSPQTWGLDGIRHVVLADLGEEGSQRSEHSTNKLWREGEDGLTRPPGQLSPRNAGTTPSQPGVNLHRVSVSNSQNSDRNREKREAPRVSQVQGQDRAERYLNGHAGGLSATLDDQQEAPILLILLGFQLEHWHLS